MKHYVYLLLISFLMTNCKNEAPQKEHQIIPPQQVIALFERYTKLWSDGNIEDRVISLKLEIIFILRI